MRRRCDALRHRVALRASQISLQMATGRSVAYTVSTLDTVSGGPHSAGIHILVQDISTGDIQDCGKGMLFDWSQDGKYMLVAEG